MRLLPCCHSRPAAAGRSAQAVCRPLRAREFVRRLRTTRGCFGAVVALCRESCDSLLLGSVAVQLRQGLTTLGAAARGAELAPALDAVTVPVVTLVHLAARQREADGAIQGVVHLATRWIELALQVCCKFGTSPYS